MPDHVHVPCRQQGLGQRLHDPRRAATNRSGGRRRHFGDDRLESSALFSEESCSFSQKDLVDSLRMWVDKARATLGDS